MKELKLGVMTNDELAEWFGIKPGSFRATKKKKLEELKEFCNYRVEKNKVIIEEIYESLYIKKGSESYQTIVEQLDETWAENGLDTCANVNKIIYKNNNLTVSEKTSYAYVCAARTELYGKPFGAEGKLGRCSYVWCKKVDDGKLEKFNDEENAVKDRLKTKYFGDATEKELMIKDMIDMGEITKEEAWSYLEEISNMDNNYRDFLAELHESIDAIIVKGTLVERNGLKYLEECRES